MESKLKSIVDNEVVSEMYHVRSIEWLRHVYYMKSSDMFDIVEAQKDIINFIEELEEEPNLILNYECYSGKEHLKVLQDELVKLSTNYRKYFSLIHMLETVNDKRLNDSFIQSWKLEDAISYQEFRENRKILIIKEEQVKELIKKTLASYDR